MTTTGSVSDVCLRVTQLRSGIGTKPKHRATLRALGLRGIGRSSVLPDSASVRGMVSRVSHLVEVSVAGSDELRVRPQRRSDARKAAEARSTARAAGVKKASTAGGLQKAVRASGVKKAKNAEKTPSAAEAGEGKR